MRRLTSDEVHAHKIAQLGLDASALDLTAIEAIAAALRRAAGLLCPCSAPTLVRAILRPLDGLVSDLETVKEMIEATIDAMVAHGDLLEHRDIAVDAQATKGVLLYAAPPSFVARDSGAALLLGITPDDLSPLTPELAVRVEYVNHIRRLPAAGDEDLGDSLTQLGLLELSFQAWLKPPPVESPVEHVAQFDHLLETTEPARSIPGLLLLDPTRPVRYYRGRWAEPKAQTGRFVARRSQAYGADLWCYVKIRDGVPERFIDLPLPGGRYYGCDEAWRLQMAIDSVRGEPQRFRLRQGAGTTRVLELFSPVPRWARRRWDALGAPVLSTGCLFAYRFADSEVEEELRFIDEMLWLAPWTDRPTATD